MTRSQRGSASATRRALDPHHHGIEAMVGGDDQRPKILVPTEHKEDDEEGSMLVTDSGRRMSQKNFIGPAPSTRAASINSSGPSGRTGETGMWRSPRRSAG